MAHFTAGQILTAAELNQMHAVCQVSRTGHSYPNNTEADASWDTDDLDPLNWHDTGSTPTRVTPTIAGWYRLTVNWEWDSDTDYTTQMVRFTKNGSAITVPEMGLRLHPTTQTHVGRMTATSCLVQANGTTDYFGVTAIQVNTSTGTNTADSKFLVELVYPT